MTKVIWFAIVACPLYLIREHPEHVRNDFCRHVNEAFAKDKAKMR